MTAEREDRDEDRPAGLTTIVVSVLLGLVALAGLTAAVSGSVMVLFVAHNFVWGSPGGWRFVGILAVNLLIVAAALWGLALLKPWKGRGGPVSPATRRTNKLYWIKETLGGVAILALFLGGLDAHRPFAVFSNGPLPLWIAVVAIPSWLVARLIREAWRNSADEHERRASDFGRNAATGVFLAVTPAWWVAARAGLAPQPDAMILWILTMVVSTIGWSWRRSN
jgi:hypothetical protein